MLSNKRTTLSTYAYDQIKRLKILHHYFGERYNYPRDSRFESAIYDLEEIEIFSTLSDKAVQLDRTIYQTQDKIHFVKILDIYYLGTKFLVIEVDDDNLWYNETLRNILLYNFGTLFILSLFGLLLAKLFVKPMHDSIILLDRFIKDTTHELNTPLSAILANIEMMDKSIMVAKNRKKLDRITIAAKTVSVLYEDLTFLTLDSERESHDETLDIKKILEERIEYFETLSRSKKITISHHLEALEYCMDRKKFIRVVDNLLSNAIKYNKRGGTINLVLTNGMFIIADSGIGIEEEKIPFIFDRYMRFNSSEGGFGVGLSIAKKILDDYDITIEVDSQVGRGTKMVIRW